LKKLNSLWNVIGADGMAVSNDFQNKSENLLQQLGGCKFIAEINRDLLNKDPFLKEFLAFKMDVAQGYIAELQIYERLGDQSKCKSAAENALFFLRQIQVLIDRMLDDQCEEAWLDFQKELRFTNHIPFPYEYVLKQNTNELALAA